MANTHSLDLESSSSQYAAAADSASLSITGDMTIEGWIKLESLPGSGVGYDILSKHDNGAGNQRSWTTTYENSGGTLRFTWRNSSDGTSGNQTTANWNATLVAGIYYHVAFAYSTSGTVICYLNGTSLGSVGSMKTSIFNSTTRLTLGARDNGGGTATAYFDGLIDDVRLWAATRTQAQIIGSKNTELVGNETNLNAYWKLDNSYADSTANGNTLTASGSPVFSTDMAFSDTKIALGYAANQAVTTSTNTIAMTCGTGMNYLIVYVGLDGSGASVSSITWNGVALTAVPSGTATIAAINHSEAAYYMVAPAVGSFNLVLTKSGGGANFSYLQGAFYSGAKQTGTPDVVSTQSNLGSGSSLTQSLTTLANNAWTSCMVVNDSSVSLVAGTGSFQRGTSLNNAVGFFDSGGPIATAGSYSMTANSGASGNRCGIMVSIPPVAGINYTTTLTESKTVTDDLLAAPARVLTESKTATDTFASAFIILETLSEAVSAIDSMIRSGIRTLTESITATATFIQESVRSLLESITASDTFATVLAYGRILTESVGVTDTIRKVLNGSSTIWNSLTKIAGSWINRDKI